MRKSRVLIIDNSPSITGALRSIVNIASDLRHEYDFYFIIARFSNSRRWIEERGFVEISELNLLELSRRPSSFFFYVPQLLINVLKLKKFIRRNQIDLIHVNDLYNLLPAVSVITGAKTPFVCHVRFLPAAFPPILFKFWLKLNYAYAARIILVSAFQKKTFPVHKKIEVIPGELPPEERYPTVSGSGPGEKRFLYLSNYTQGKGQDHAIRAFSIVSGRLPGWKLRFAGDDNGLEKNILYRAGLQRLAGELGLAERIEWEGVTADVEREYKSADIVLNFSESESFSMTCLEALFYGRPLIATDSGGPGEIIEAGETGLLVANKDHRAMADAMLSLAGNEALRGEMGIKARKSVRNKFSKERTTMLVGKLYAGVLKETR